MVGERRAACIIIHWFICIRYLTEKKTCHLHLEDFWEYVGGLLMVYAMEFISDS